MGNTVSILLTGLRVYKILRISQILAHAAVLEGYEAKTAEFTNEPLMMNELAHIRIGGVVDSPLVSRGDAAVAVCFEPLPAVRVIQKYLSREGIIVMNIKSFLPSRHLLPQAVSLFKDCFKKVYEFDYLKIRGETDSPQTACFAVLGMLLETGMLPVDEENIVKAAREIQGVSSATAALRTIASGRKVIRDQRI